MPKKRSNFEQVKPSKTSEISGFHYDPITNRHFRIQADRSFHSVSKVKPSVQPGPKVDIHSHVSLLSSRSVGNISYDGFARSFFQQRLLSRMRGQSICNLNHSTCPLVSRRHCLLSADGSYFLYQTAQQRIFTSVRFRWCPKSRRLITRHNVYEQTSLQQRNDLRTAKMVDWCLVKTQMEEHDVDMTMCGFHTSQLASELVLCKFQHSACQIVSRMTLSTNYPELRAVAWSNLNQTAWFAGEKRCGMVQICNNKVVVQWRQRTCATCLAVDGMESFVACGGRQGLVTLLDPRRGSGAVCEFNLPHRMLVAGLAWVPSVSTCVLANLACHSAGFVFLYDMRTLSSSPKPLFCLNGEGPPGCHYSSTLHVNAEMGLRSTVLATTGLDKTIRAWLPFDKTWSNLAVAPAFQKASSEPAVPDCELIGFRHCWPDYGPPGLLLRQSNDLQLYAPNYFLAD